MRSGYSTTCLGSLCLCNLIPPSALSLENALIGLVVIYACCFLWYLVLSGEPIYDSKDIAHE